MKRKEGEMNHRYPQIIGIFMLAAAGLLLSPGTQDPKEGQTASQKPDFIQIEPVATDVARLGDICRSEFVSKLKAGEQFQAAASTVAYNEGSCVAGEEGQIRWKSPNISI
jgi:hypothetical protein